MPLRTKKANQLMPHPMGVATTADNARSISTLPCEFLLASQPASGSALEMVATQAKGVTANDAQAKIQKEWWRRLHATTAMSNTAATSAE